MEAETAYQIGKEVRIQAEATVKEELGSIDGIPNEKINEVTRGWINYYRIADMKGIVTLNRR